MMGPRLTNHITIWEWTSAVAFVGMGGLGVVAPESTANSVIFLLMSRWVGALILSAAVCYLGILRLTVCFVSPSSMRTRGTFAMLSAMIWGQWVVGFYEALPMQGWRAGMMHVGAMVLGEVLLVYWLVRRLPQDAAAELAPAEEPMT